MTLTEAMSLHDFKLNYLANFFVAVLSMYVVTVVYVCRAQLKNSLLMHLPDSITLKKNSNPFGP